MGSASQGVSLFFEQMSRDTISAAQTVNSMLGGAFDELNSALEKIVEIHTKTFYEFTRAVKKDFEGMFRSISGQIAKVGIQKTEQGVAGGIMSLMGKQMTPGGIMGALTGKKGPDATVTAVEKSNDYLRDILGVLSSGMPKAPGIGSGGYNMPGTMIGAANTPVGGTGSSVANALSPFISLIPGMGGFGGHLALGGDVTAGMTYDVGEMGRERFTPSQNGKITPNKSLGGGAPVYHIDARGSNDPAQTEAAIHRAFGAYSPQIAAGTMRAQAEKRARTPTSSR